ncbi:MAG: sulfite exporter TauE/SafE family protein [Methylococcales bacterium]|jgi:uncharacterized protein|nr:sulfite exporter TauE/SafE family protein [Methylococcales bacterium]MBT7408141.1 sulfite exporter TauE/SafE family protein [Methylococcales bacterium]
MELILLFFLIGSVAGFLAGLLGIGGGLVIVPLLSLVYENYQLHDGIIMQVAIATSLSTILFTSLSSIIKHQQHRAILWEIVFKLTPGLLLGAVVGTILLKNLQSNDLKILFGCFEILIGLQFLVNFQQFNHKKTMSNTENPNSIILYVSGVFIGKISSLFGIGGGTMTVPLLTWLQINIRQAIATSAACGFPIALFATTSIVVTHVFFNEVEFVPLLIDWRACVFISISSVFFAFLGASKTHQIDKRKLEILFSMILIITGIKMCL